MTDETVIRTSNERSLADAERSSAFWKAELIAANTVIRTLTSTVEGIAAGRFTESGAEEVAKATLKTIETMVHAESAPPSCSHETPEQRTDHAENLAKALEHYLNAHDTLSSVQDSDEVTGRGDASDCGFGDIANDAWRAMRTALYEYRKRRSQKAKLGDSFPEKADV